MKAKLFFILFIIAPIASYSQNFTLIGNYEFIPKLEYHNKVFGFSLGPCTTDGTLAGTTGLNGTIGNYDCCHPQNEGLDWTVYNDKIYFSGYDSNGENELWVTDGSVLGTYKLNNTIDGVKRDPYSFKNYNGKFYFSGLTSSLYNGTTQIWQSDGTIAGTNFLTILPYDLKVPKPCKFTELNGKLYFQAYKNEIWQTDGTATGTIPLKQFNNGSEIDSEIIPFQNKFLFTTKIPVCTGGTFQSCNSLWASDGTTDGTTIIQELNQDGYFPNVDFTPINSKTNRNFILYNNKFYFISNFSLRVTDGTTAGTSIVKDMVTYLGGNEEMILFNNKMYFIKNRALWVSDGTEQGTSIVKQLPDWQKTLIVSNNLLYFVSYNPNNSNYELNLWVSDGTTAGTNPVGTPVSLPGALNQYSLFSYNNDLYISTLIPHNYSSNNFWKLSQSGLNVNGLEDKKDFVLYPNPLESLLNIDSKTTIKKIDIYNNIGQVLLSFSNENRINISSLNSGVYFVRVEDINGNFEIKKAIKK